MADKLITVEEAAERLGKSRTEFAKILERGYIPAIRREAGLLIRLSEVDAYRTRQRERKLEAHTPKAPKSRKRPGRVPR